MQTVNRAQFDLSQKASSGEVQSPRRMTRRRREELPPPPAIERSRVIDAARGAAAVWVLLYHAVFYLQLPLCGGLLGNFPDWLTAGRASQCLVDPQNFDALDKMLYALVQPLFNGHLGVAMFFVISGFCIHMPLANRIAAGHDATIGTGAYLKRRFFRLYPTHVFALVGSIILVMLTHELVTNTIGGEIIHMPLDVLVAHFAMLQAQLTDTNSYLFYYNANLWSLETELQLYVVYLFVSRFLVSPNWGRTLAILAVLDLVYFRLAYCVPHGFEWAWAVKTFFFGHLYEWYLGAYLVHQYVRKQSCAATLPTLAGMAALLGIGRCLLPGFDTVSTNDMTFATAFAIVLYWLVVREAVEKSEGGRIFAKGLPALIFAVMTYLGERSYSIYLWQSPVIRAVVISAVCLAPAIGAHYSTALAAAAIACIGSLLVGELAFLLVERHFLGARR